MTTTSLDSAAFELAKADPKAWAPEPGMLIRPFHQPFPGMPDLFHVYCENHPAYGFCGTDAEAREAALKHGQKHSRPTAVTTPDLPTTERQS